MARVVVDLVWEREAKGVCGLFVGGVEEEVKDGDVKMEDGNKTEANVAGNGAVTGVDAKAE